MISTADRRAWRGSDVKTYRPQDRLRMTDFYVMLGLIRTASPEEIRAAYLERMKVLHPDRHGPIPPGAPSAADLNYAYWVLRDAERRVAYDRALTPLPPKPRRRSRHARQALQKVAPGRSPKKRPYYRPRRSTVSARARIAAALAFVLLAAAVGAGALTVMPQNQGRSVWAQNEMADSKKVQRRALDETLAGAAAAEFQTILRGAGFPGAASYGRRCFDELAVQPSAVMVDYCLAFDRTAAEWEGVLITTRRARRYFDADSRIQRYEGLARSLDESSVRQALEAEAAFLTGS